ncbi:MAG: FAD-binding oxidoreductase [Pontixanthobacter sp.]
MTVSATDNAGCLVRQGDQSLVALRRMDTVDRVLVEMLAKVVGAGHVMSDFDERAKYAQDKLPFAKYKVRSGFVAGTVPSAIARPKNSAEVSAIAKLAQRENFRLIPVGGRSGVLGGTVPLSNEVMLDLGRLDSVVDFNTVDGTITVQAGLFGGDLEKFLNDSGWTCGHFPQSMLISTVGGWAACRGGGQATSRYGKIEDMITGIEVVLPDGRIIRVKPAPRRAVGPSITDLFVGSEGTLGVITEVTLRIWRMPEVNIALCCAFRDHASALISTRQIMQSELRPEIIRIYDATETHQRVEGVKEFDTHPIMGMYSFCGLSGLAIAERDEALAIICRNGGIATSDTPFRKWHESRYVSLSDTWTSKGWFMDTIEVTVPWSRVLQLYEMLAEAVRAVHKDVYFGAHWSHAYADGVCQYMTFRLPPMSDAEALPLHASIWETVEQATLDHGGSISHHHGIGVFRNRWMEKEHGDALTLIQQIKDVLDPQNLINPGKLGLRAPADAVSLPPARTESKVE